jgi:hypothetical protein
MPNARPFLEFLREQRNGRLHDELSDALQECVAATAEHGKTSTLTLTVQVKKSSTGKSTIMVVDDVKTKLPKEERESSIFFVSPENNFMREDPRQHKMEFRELPTRTVREVLDA